MWRVHLRVAARALSARAARSLLTVSSITLGVLAIVLMTSLAGSGLATIMLGLEELSAGRMLLLTPKPPERAQAKAATVERGLSPDGHQALTADVPHLHASALSSSRGVHDVTADSGRRSRTDLVAADPGFFDVFRMRVATGRRLLASDGQAAARVCVVGPKLADKLWHGTALGHALTVAGQRCRVVGVLASNDRFGTNFGFEWDDLVVMPFETVAASDSQTEADAQIALVTDEPSHNDIVKRVVNQRMVARRGNVDNFTFYDLGNVVEKFESTFQLMQGLVGLVAGIALLIGGIGVMNMMLVNVSERVSEVGLRKALGATPSAIRSQFVVEAVLLSSLGGVVGVLVGVGMAVAAGVLVRTALSSWVVSVSWPAAVVALLTTVAIGGVFGYLPARTAARLSPVEAMRR
jgi:putative ABC transport system permease protein